MSQSSPGVETSRSTGRYGAMLGLVALTLAYIPMRFAMESLSADSALYDFFYLYGTALQITFAFAIIAVAIGIGVKQPVGKQWLLLGAGVGMFAIGDIVWTVFELFMHIDPYPSVADVFYTAEYVFFLAAIVLAIRGYTGLVKIGRPLLIAGIAGVLGIAVVYALVLKPYVFSSGAGDLSLIEKIVDTLYPVGDVAFMFAPAIALALVVAQLGMGKLARPWWIVVAGAFTFALADSLNTFVNASGGTVTPLLDMGWLAANLLLAIAALIARDAYRTA